MVFRRHQRLTRVVCVLSPKSWTGRWFSTQWGNVNTGVSQFIAKQVYGIPRSGIRDFFDIVQGMKDVISLGVGEPDFATPWHIREAAIYALEKGRTSYTSNLGLLKLREAIAESIHQNFHVKGRTQERNPHRGGRE